MESLARSLIFTLLLNLAQATSMSLSGNFEGSMSLKGCFETPTAFIKERTDSYNSNNECAKFCSDLGTSVFATSGEKCFCLKEVPTKKAKTEECNTRCPDSIFKGKNLFSMKANVQENQRQLLKREPTATTTIQSVPSFASVASWVRALLAPLESNVTA